MYVKHVTKEWQVWFGARVNVSHESVMLLNVVCRCVTMWHCVMLFPGNRIQYVLCLTISMSQRQSLQTLFSRPEAGKYCVYALYDWKTQFGCWRNLKSQTCLFSLVHNLLNHKHSRTMESMKRAGTLNTMQNKVKCVVVFLFFALTSDISSFCGQRRPAVWTWKWKTQVDCSQSWWDLSAFIIFSFPGKNSLTYLLFFLLLLLHYYWYCYKMSINWWSKLTVFI